MSQRPDQSRDTDTVALNIDPKQLMSMLRHAASQDRTVIEFRRTEQADGTKALDTALDITEHVKDLET